MVCLNTPLQAQTSLGQIAGIVPDSTGAVIPGATVTITDVGTQAAHTVISDSAGFSLRPTCQSANTR